MRLTKQFIKEIAKMQPIPFLGIVNLLHIKWLDENNQIRDFSDVLSEMIDRFAALDKARKKEILLVMRAAIRDEEEEKNGASTADSKASFPN